MKHLYACLLLLPTFGIAQPSGEKPVSTQIRNVTVFLDGAQLTRTGQASVPDGKTTLLFKGLSPFIDPQSIQVKLTGNITIMSVNHQIDFLSERAKSGLSRRIETVSDSLAYQRAQRSVLADEEKMLMENKAIGGNQTGYQLTDLKAISAYYASRLREIRLQSLQIEKVIDQKQQDSTKLQRQLQELSTSQKLNASNIVVHVSAENALTTAITLSYVVQNAGWYPNYDIRAKDIASPVQLVYKANVHQNTGENWTNVKLTLSNATPSQSGDVPVLNPYYLSFNQANQHNAPVIRPPGIRSVSGKVVDAVDQQPLPGVNVLLKGSSVGTTTNANGDYSLALPGTGSVLVFSYIGYLAQELIINNTQINAAMGTDVSSLEEVVVTGYGGKSRRIKSNRQEADAPEAAANIIPTTSVENQTSVEFVVDVPYSVPSDGENYAVDVAAYAIPAQYEYQCLPKADNQAFLIARITDWNQYNLLEGEVNLFFEGTYVGKSILDVRYVSDTLNLSLGRDRNVSVQREKVTDFNKKRLIGTNRTESRVWKITVRNNKSQPVSLTLKDQIPVTATSDISVEDVDVTGGKLNQDTGEVTWTLTLPPKGQQTRQLKYAVKYPKDRRLVVE